MAVSVVAPSVPSLDHERATLAEGFLCPVGVDEVGRGSWAGPLVAAAVSLPLQVDVLPDLLAGVRDSKLLTDAQRRRALADIVGCGAAIALGWSSHHVIDRIGLAAANRRAMCRAIARLKVAPDVVLVDHFALPECDLPQRCITRGDAQCLSIAAASVVAKVFRDDWMEYAERRHPGYGFDRHRGYGTAEHRVALHRLGVSPLHRRTFGPVALLES